LDLEAQRSIGEALQHARSCGVTVLPVTHDLRVAEQADHCLLLHRGTVVAAGAPAAVLTQGMVARTWGVPATPRAAQHLNTPAMPASTPGLGTGPCCRCMPAGSQPSATLAEAQSLA
jgi:ABC-type cobalamin/Fe3+-siderophores transport system ATPase subunit